MTMAEQKFAQKSSKSLRVDEDSRRGVTPQWRNGRCSEGRASDISWQVARKKESSEPYSSEDPNKCGHLNAERAEKRVLACWHRMNRNRSLLPDRVEDPGSSLFYEPPTPHPLFSSARPQPLLAPESIGVVRRYCLEGWLRAAAVPPPAIGLLGCVSGPFTARPETEPTNGG
ncbi:hypothetical protein MTO96_003356 [Rhipicephalus appendiculatus]